jgi:hypothetical protein
MQPMPKEDHLTGILQKDLKIIYQEEMLPVLDGSKVV